jgi:hypothetical protein
MTLKLFKKIAPTMTLALGLGIFSGCANMVQFGSATPLGAGVQGKFWQPPTFVDDELYIPAAQAPNGGLVRDFSAASYGDQLQLIGSWFDSGTASLYRGYARSYTDGAGWAALGPEFSQVAADTNAYYTTSLAVGPGGLFMANFLTTSGGASASYSGSGWQRYLNTTGGAFPNPGSATRPGASVMDSLGRGYLFYTNGTRLYETPWALADPNGFSISANDVSGAGIEATANVTARFDGVTQVCATYEMSTSELKASCQNIACAAPFTFTGTHPTIDTSVVGHDSATDGEGHIMVVYYRGSHVYAKMGISSGSCGYLSEAWSSNRVRIDTQSDGYLAPSSDAVAFPNGSRPGVTYLGSGRYLAAWIGVNSSAHTTRVYSSVFDPDYGWQDNSNSNPDSLQYMSITPPNDSDSYTTVAHAQTLTAFSNGQGNAGIAVTTIVATAATSIYPEDAHVRSIAVNRWQEDVGWTGMNNFGPVIEGGLSTTPGTTCFNLLEGTRAADGSGDGDDCNHPPVGVILPSGTSLVFFQAQDNYPKASGSDIIPGNRRLSVTEFR